MDKYIGKKLDGRYEIRELIGIGGMANVYLAYDAIDDREVAVKILREEYMGNTEFQRRFKNESKAIAVLSHPNIVKVYDVSFTNRINSIVMEYIDGISLKDYITQQGKLSYKEAVYFTLQILRALQHAHDKGIVHRDIKPQNIMLLQNGQIKITDFGIARFARSESRTITDRAIGSVHYISPEQAKGDVTDERTDIYSVGVMLFEMLTGKLPFEANSAVSVAIKQIQSEAVLPRSINPGIPAGLEEITLRAMQKNPAFRYQSAAEMIRDMERFKREPDICFHYLLDMEDSPVKKGKQVNKKQSKKNEEGPAEDMTKKEKGSPFLPILTGVTFAFVLATAGFIAMMIWLNNPFVTVGDTTLPDLVGLKYDTVIASQEYSDFSIVLDGDPEFNDQYGRGVIFSQSPREGITVKKGSTIKVKVSSGQKEIKMPDLSGVDSFQALAKLSDLGLDYEERRMFSEDVPAGSVIYTDPSKDLDVTGGQVITVYVSMGPEDQIVSVPDLTGIKLEDAKRMLQSSKLVVGNITYDYSEMPANTVIAQDPSGGELQPEGTAVNLVLSEGDGGYTRLSLPVDLPTNIKEKVTMRAKVGDVIVAEDILTPSEDNVWKPQFDGSDDEVLTVRIYINNYVYRRYTINFEEGTHSLVSDYGYRFADGLDKVTDLE